MRTSENRVAACSRWPGVAFSEISLLWLVIATTLTVFGPVSRVRCPAACALACLGEFRRGDELHFVATEPWNF
jgi:hypothetical protein